jgi:hypothetical protein
VEPPEDLKTESGPDRIMQRKEQPEPMHMILSGHDSVFLLSCWLRLCRAVSVAAMARGPALPVVTATASGGRQVRHRAATL